MARFGWDNVAVVIVGMDEGYHMNLAVRDIARLLKVSEDRVYEWIEEQGLPAARMNGQWRANGQDLLEWATTTGRRLSPECLQLFTGAADDLPLVSNAIEEGSICYDVPGTNPTEVLHAVVRLLNLPKHVDRDFLLQVLLAREALGSTAVGDGIAIPHPRNPIVLGVERPSIHVAFLQKPVDFKAPDRKPVNVLFTLVSTTTRIHLHLLSRLAFLLHDANVRQALQRHAPPAEFLGEVRRVEENPAFSKALFTRAEKPAA
jgi:nitrogen PTS system EIIA component